MVARSNRARQTIKDLQNQVLTNYRRAFFMSEISRGTLVGQFRIKKVINHNNYRQLRPRKQAVIAKAISPQISSIFSIRRIVVA